eukprot:CAMPEP_0170865092 /NCGR_PEP_ID=MMETSP0734-20130129/21006_1 /TAXON_ID=186038 /ORGANISM="Fragilariopsis kerguelensis, Strain L26-C5" /LENGTH=35 /DNA_ID= /DNA_START= /DNA_END= /DNA_ORIENTATION=
MILTIGATTGRGAVVESMMIDDSCSDDGGHIVCLR